mmetsp:Transcript_96341/g.171206  ORF Transcript_96341/g.171206 Transcript_96341/m.171206 type:complete len:548 (+) Transcript_96341:25-1668(+)|eukprot:CAMPEP_0197663738 /NCGR_PEP_ID=MMETSP1338-20131121/58208_1 /TAXON_ID=43686 ORGANISM="Pelagodinium beii, Strain RCC1491" /NCGR_SAMPLE_ID=MMETSP1338 /ASSEMBLY_ACC=CAM_ASM_000754 /LENGTH=547 /DNA_ID=CAMNT_0043242227 /DNA_START=25 /DNA_END=1668 /DNA_ORIENTATION=+
MAGMAHAPADAKPRSARKVSSISSETPREPICAAGQRDADANVTASLEDFGRISSLAFDDLEGQEALKARLGAVTRRQDEWQRQLQSVDEKQAELSNLQWKLVREQCSALAKELAVVQSQLKDLKVDSRRALIEVEKYFRDNESKANEERGLRLAMFESLEERSKKMKQDLDAEASKRSSADAEVSSKVEGLMQGLQSRSKDHQNLESELSKLQQSSDNTSKELDALKLALAQESSQRHVAEEELTQLMHDVREVLSKESQSRASADEALREALDQAIQQEKAARGADLKSLGSTLKDLAPLRDEISPMKARISEVESFLSTRLKDTHLAFEQELNVHSAVQQRHEEKINDLVSAAEAEASTRKGLGEEIDQALKVLRSKMKHLVNEQTESTRNARDAFEQQLQQLRQESHSREVFQSSIQGMVEDHRALFNEKIEALHAVLRDVEHRHGELLQSELKELTEEMGRQLRETQEGFRDGLLEERKARELQGEGFEEHVDFLESFLQDARELFLQRGSRQRRLASKKTQLSTPVPGSFSPRDERTTGEV